MFQRVAISTANAVARRSPATTRKFSSSAATDSSNTKAIAAAVTGLAAMAIVGYSSSGSNEVVTAAASTPEVVEVSVPEPASEDTTSLEVKIASLEKVIEVGVATMQLLIDEKCTLESRVAALEKTGDINAAEKVNRAFVFIKPHAVTEKVEKLIEETLGAQGFSISKQGELGYKEIDEKQLIDTHYGAIASKAVKLEPKELNVSQKAKAAFEKSFNMKWEDAVEKGLVYNAKQACEKLDVDGQGLDSKWSTLKKGENLIKFGGGFYCGQLQEDMFVINGFYMSMRSKYASAPAKIKYYLVEWNPAKLSWEEFRSKTLGGTNPDEAEKGSLRRMIYDSWEELGLPAQPDVGDNGVHGSASPFEAMAERTNWIEAPLEGDEFAKGLLAAGIPKDTIQSWMGDAQVPYNGETQSIFDLLEDIDSGLCLQKAVDINKQ